MGWPRGMPCARTHSPRWAFPPVRCMMMVQSSVWRVGIESLRNEPSNYAQAPGVFACVCHPMAPAVQDLLQASTYSVWKYCVTYRTAWGSRTRCRNAPALEGHTPCVSSARELGGARGLAGESGVSKERQVLVSRHDGEASWGASPLGGLWADPPRS